MNLVDYLLDSDLEPPASDPNVPRPEAPRPKNNDIKRVFHPHSERPEVIMSFEEYRAAQVPPKRRLLNDEEPWSPFLTRLDFELAEFVQDTMLNEKQTNRLISLIRDCSANIEGFTLRSHSDLEKQWTHVSKKCTEFQRFEITVPYDAEEEERTFEMYARPLWNWAMDIVQDPHLADFFPWTAAAMWDIQSKIPKSIHNKLLPFIIYADKAKLSSFGTQKGYPAIARLGNTVVSLRNSSSWGGGQIVGWLPVVEEDPAETGKPDFVNFKCAVWRSAFYKLLESIVTASKTGIMTECGDGVWRCLFPFILILAADYEEAQVCVMALIRGLRALFPCPICYVKQEEQSHLSKPLDLRTSEQSQQTVAEARKLKTKQARDEVLKSRGLRNVDNVFWNVAYSDPHQALSFEHLHSYSSGLWGRHLFERTKTHAEQLPGRAAAEIDKQFASFPRSRNLNHFDAVMSIAFNDGTKHEDIAKMIVLASHNVLERPIDRLLLQLCRSYQELSLYATMKLQTTDRIHDGEEELEKFGSLLAEYVAKAGRIPGLDDKNWNFPKIHAHKHLFDDIRRKGVSRNFGAKIDEAVHGSIRTTYQRQTNFKDIAPQILQSQHRTMVGKFIRDQINDLDEIRRCECEMPDEEAEDEAPRDLADKVDNVALGSKLPAIAFDCLEREMQTDTAFTRFRLKFSTFFASFLDVYEGGNRVNLKSKDEIVPYRFLKIFYQSLDDWSDLADLLRCNPCFHGQPRFDAVLVLTEAGPIFAQLIYVFEVSVNGKVYPFALVQPLDSPVGAISAKDKALKLFRVRAKPRHASEFIPVRSIIRGAVVVPDSKKSGDFFVMDVQEGDMFLRLRDMYRARFNR
ncbi:hypothetical protein C8R45DRAFT_848162 [Mycena sanguinolenta]|nr:hypothetical protein C8R45DRAFT_848162 [Mycena sanguinolenta]